jgi:hypothetical protein
MLFSFPPSFLAWVFVRAMGAALVFFFLSFKKNTSAASVLAYKNHDKKVEGNSAKQPAFGAACRAFAAWACLAFDDDDDLFRCWAFILSNRMIFINVLNHTIHFIY